MRRPTEDKSRQGEVKPTGVFVPPPAANVVPRQPTEAGRSRSATPLSPTELGGTT